MKLLTAEQRRKLIENGRQAEKNPEFDPYPVVKLFTPDAAATWLLAWIDPTEPDIAFGIADLGLGFVEYGTMSLDELASIRGRLGLPIERDRHFTADKPMSAYFNEAQPGRRLRC